MFTSANLDFIAVQSPIDVLFVEKSTGLKVVPRFPRSPAVYRDKPRDSQATIVKLLSEQLDSCHMGTYDGVTSFPQKA
jgi:hypothetical protein